MVWECRRNQTDTEGTGSSMKSTISPKQLDASYMLRNKDIPLIRFSLHQTLTQGFGEQQHVYSVHITEINEEKVHLLPYALRHNRTDRALLTWIDRRKAPKNRQFVEKIMKAIEDDGNPLRYVDISHALSLNDTLWITNDSFDIKWKDFNLYDHPFDDVLAYVAFSGYSKRVTGVISSPELTSSGVLKKCWLKRPEGIYLLKGDDFLLRPDGRSQATMEYYAAQVAAVMNFDHIDYDLELFHHRDGVKEIICNCKLFTSEDIGFVNAYDFFRDRSINVAEEDLSRLDIQEQMAYTYGLKDYQDMMVFDSIICNQDRHLGNFGYLVDNNTGHYRRPAPLFDNGLSLLLGAARNDMAHVDDYLETVRGKYLDFDTQARLFTASRHLPQIRSLLNFRFKKHPQYNVTDDTLDKMSYLVQKRVHRILEIYQEKKRQHRETLTR